MWTIHIYRTTFSNMYGMQVPLSVSKAPACKKNNNNFAHTKKEYFKKNHLPLNNKLKRLCLKLPQFLM